MGSRAMRNALPVVLFTCFGSAAFGNPYAGQMADQTRLLLSPQAEVRPDAVFHAVV